jgi:hypothetical protein
VTGGTVVVVVVGGTVVVVVVVVVVGATVVVTSEVDGAALEVVVATAIPAGLAFAPDEHAVIPATAARAAIPATILLIPTVTPSPDRRPSRDGTWSVERPQ